MTLAIGNSQQFQWQATNPIDNSQWDLTGSIVTFVVSDPNGSQTTYPTTVTGTPGVATTGFIQFNTLIIGTWSYCWKATQAGIPYVTLPVGFTVEASP